MAWTIELSGAARKALGKLDKAAARRVTRFLRDSLASAEDPRALGKPLRGELREYWRYRVGDYRLITHIEDARVRVLVVRIAHRREAYR